MLNIPIAGRMTAEGAQFRRQVSLHPQHSATRPKPYSAMYCGSRLRPPDRDPVVRGAHTLHGLLLRSQAGEELLLLAQDGLQMRGNQQRDRWRKRARSRRRGAPPLAARRSTAARSRTERWSAGGSETPRPLTIPARSIALDARPVPRRKTAAEWPGRAASARIRRSAPTARRSSRPGRRWTRSSEPPRGRGRPRSPADRCPRCPARGRRSAPRPARARSRSPVIASQAQRHFVVEREGDVRVLDHQVAIQRAGIAQMLQDRRVDLRVLLQPGVSGKLEEGQQREAADGRTPIADARQRRVGRRHGGH